MKKTKKRNKQLELSDEKLLERISNIASRSEKTSWQRKMNNMEDMLKQLRPLEDKIMQLNAEAQPIYDAMAILRSIMVTECVHPRTHLIIKDGYIECKFCEKHLKLPGTSPLIGTNE